MTTSDIEIITVAADALEHRLTPPRLDPRPVTYRDLIDALDKESLLEFGQRII